MSLMLTESAAEHVKTYGGIDAILRIAAVPDGCSGLSYRAAVVEGIDDSDYVYASLGVTIIVDSHSLPFIDGTLIDYTKEGLNEGFVYNNPNAKNTCGCGESFKTGE